MASVGRIAKRADAAGGAPRRTFAVGDVHGDIDQLETLLGRLPPMTGADTLLFVGDYIDRGPHPSELRKPKLLPSLRVYESR